MRVFAESQVGGGIVEITSEDIARAVIEYVETARRYGLSELEIGEDVGGWEVAGKGYDGLVPWACEAVFRCGDVYLGDPGIYFDQ